MLRASIEQTNHRLNLAAVVDHAQPAGVPEADAIIRFTHTLVENTDQLPDARAALVASLGAAGAAAIAGAVGNFEMMNRILDATGVPAPGSMADLTERLRS